MRFKPLQKPSFAQHKPERSKDEMPEAINLFKVLAGGMGLILLILLCVSICGCKANVGAEVAPPIVQERVTTYTPPAAALYAPPAPVTYYQPPAPQLAK